ncbi:hypothetical protein [Enterovibrio calviensis]|uniref:hypothetical protein n=1 Tax=Enterovibrio calviensis TaxID=91359 RepID=UPI000481D49D|nr:hypothetical protein [Enterovibrio calviensis]
MKKRTLIAVVFTGLAFVPGLAFATGGVSAVPIYRCVVDDNNIDSTYVPAYVCRNMNGKVIL